MALLDPGVLEPLSREPDSEVLEVLGSTLTLDILVDRSLTVTRFGFAPRIFIREVPALLSLEPRETGFVVFLADAAP